jgi:hypothetical protein
VADIQTSEDMGLSLPKVAGGEPKTIVAERGEELSGIIESLVARMRVIRSGGMDPTTDNALSVTNDGRDAAIDLRLYDPKMPDRPTSKLNLAIENVARIAEVTAQERKTQVIWLDRGVPGSNTIDLYEDIRSKLVARGIGEAEIAFIHGAGDSDVKRQGIFDRVHSGEVRILIGSTEKMGVGANIQARLTAAHHLDAPWRPADVMQRDGRILRFGNMNDTVQIFRYVTKGSFDAYNWQTLDNKAGFLNQLATDDMTVREIEDVAKTALSYAEVTALAAQDPRIMDLVRLGEQVRKLRAAEQAHQTTEFQRRQQLRAIPRDRERLQRGIVEAEKAIRAIDKLAAADPDELPLVVAGERFAKHKDAGEALGSEIKRVFAADEGDPGPIGDLYGFPIKPRKLVFYEDGKPKDVAALRIDFGNGHTVEVVLGEDAVGNVARVLHVVERMKAGLTENRELLANLDREAARIRKIVGEPFAKEAELQEQEAELAALKAELTGQKAQPLPPIDRAAIVETFPGSLVTAVSEAGTGYRVELPGGRWLEVVVETDIDVDWPAAEAAAGRRIPLAERAKLAAAGAFTLRTRDGTTHGGLGLIRLANGLADAGTLRHEAIHLAREAGLFLDAEWQSLVDAYSDQSRSAQRQEEDIATAAETWGGKQGLAQKIKAWINTLLNVAGISRIDHRTVEFMVGQRAFWGRPAAPKAGQIQSVRHQLRRRPPLANPAAEAVARDLVRETDALMASIGEPPPRPRMVAREQARVAVRADAMGQHDRLLAVGEAGQSYESEADNDAAQLIIDQLGIKAFSSNNEADRQRAVRFVMAYRRARTETARLLGAGTQQALPGETPTQQRARNLREDILTPPEFYERKYKGEKEIAAAWTRQIEKIRVQLKAIGIDLDHLEDYVRDAVTFARVKKMIEPAKASRWDKAYEIWLNSILSSVTTAKVNLYGNLGHAAWALTAERLVEIGVNAVFRNPSEAQVGELKYLLAGILPGLSRGAANALKSWETETPWFETSLGIGVDAKNSAYQRIETPRVAIGGALGRGVRALGFRHLLAADEFSKSLIAQMEAGAQAYRMARAEGLRGEEMKLRIAELLADLKSDAWVKAHDLAVELAFQRKLGPFGRSILKFREGAPGARYIIPFVVTPGNIFKTGIKKSPLGTVKLAEQVYRGFRRGDWSGIQPMIAQQLIAWTGMLALMGYIDDEEGNPNITGTTAEYSYRTRVTAQRTYPTQSIRIGGKWWSYSRLEPFATTLGLTVDWLRALRRPQSHHAANEAIQSLIGQLHNKTFLRGVADFMDAIDSETPAEGLAKWASSFTTSWIPRLVQVPLREASADYVDRKFWGDGPDWWLRLWRRTVQKSELGIIPDQPAYDLWGRTAPRPGAPWAHGPRTDYLWRILEPFAVRTDRPMSAGDRAIVNWNNANPGQPYNPLPPAPYYKGTNGDRVGMTDEQKSDYYRLAGRVAAQLVELEISDPSDPTENDIDTIRGALAESRRAVKALLVEAWSGGTDAGEAINGLAAEIYERQVAHQAEKLSRPVPLKWSMREKFHEDVASARQWLADRDISRRELRRIYLRRLRREMKDPTARLRRANRAARRLEPAA